MCSESEHDTAILNVRIFSQLCSHVGESVADDENAREIARIYFSSIAIWITIGKWREKCADLDRGSRGDVI